MHLLYKRIRNLNLPIGLQLQLFEHTILPIVIYGCEIWAFENTDIMEKLQNEFLRYITNLKKSTPLYMLHAELGYLNKNPHGWVLDEHCDWQVLEC